MIMVSLITRVSLISFRFIFVLLFSTVLVFVDTVNMGTFIKRHAGVKIQLSRFKFDSSLILFFSFFFYFV